MLYVFHGENIESAREKARGMIDALLLKRDGALMFRITPDEWSPVLFQEYLSGQGLFVQKYIVWLDGLFDDKDTREDVRDFLEQMKDSQNVFVVLDKKFDAESTKLIKKYAEKVVEVEDKKPLKSFISNFSIFSLADALGERDKKRMWVLYREAIDLGISPEEIVGTLFWQVKMILLAHRVKKATDAGVKDFPFSKAQRYAKNYSLDEIQKLSSDIISIYHEAHRGKVDFEIELEKLILV
jgi:DNA polymerase III delta subunit